jgi:hypothetical protein
VVSVRCIHGTGYEVCPICHGSPVITMRRRRWATLLYTRLVWLLVLAFALGACTSRVGWISGLAIAVLVLNGLDLVRRLMLWAYPSAARRAA